MKWFRKSLHTILSSIRPISLFWKKKKKLSLLVVCAADSANQHAQKTTSNMLSWFKRNPRNLGDKNSCLVQMWMWSLIRTDTGEHQLPEDTGRWNKLIVTKSDSGRCATAHWLYLLGWLGTSPLSNQLCLTMEASHALTVNGISCDMCAKSYRDLQRPVPSPHTLSGWVRTSSKMWDHFWIL